MILSHCMSKLFLLDGILKESRCSPASFIPLRISWTIAEWLSCNGRVTKKGSQEICYVYGWWNMSHYMVSSVMLASQKKSKYVKIGYPFGKHYIQIFPLPVIFHCQVWLPKASQTWDDQQKTSTKLTWDGQAFWLISHMTLTGSAPLEPSPGFPDFIGALSWGDFIAAMTQQALAGRCLHRPCHLWRPSCSPWWSRRWNLGIQWGFDMI